MPGHNSRLLSSFTFPAAKFKAKLPGEIERAGKGIGGFAQRVIADVNYHWGGRLGLLRTDRPKGAVRNFRNGGRRGCRYRSGGFFHQTQKKGRKGKKRKEKERGKKKKQKTFLKMLPPEKEATPTACRETAGPP